MIVSVRTAGIQYGKQNAAYINATFKGANVRTTRAVGGPISQVHWISEYSSLADFETIWAKIEGDSGYQALLKEARDGMLFDARTLRDDLHQTIG
jgi:hypothetical protein